MKKRIMTLVAVVLLICTLLSGCSTDIKTVSDTLRPPKLYGENGEMQKAFEKYAGKDVLMKPAVSGDYRSAFVLYDIDGDGSEEVLVFYAESSNKSAVKLAIMQKKDKQWVPVVNRPGSGSEVYSVTFSDMNKDGFSEIIVGWSLYEKSSDKIFTVFSCREKLANMDSLCTEEFTYMMPADLDNDGLEEIFYISLDATNKTRQASAKLLKLWEDNTMKPIGEVKLDAGVSGYKSVKFDPLSGSSPKRIYLDAVKGENQMITDVVYYDVNSRTLVAPLLDKESQSNIQTWRSISLPSMDVNSDGIIEIPTQSVLKGGKEVNNNNDSSSNLYRTDWCQLVGNKLQTVIYSYTDVENGYIFSIPERFLRSATIEKNSDDGIVTLYNYSRSRDKRGDALLTIKSVDESVWASATNKSGFREIMSANGKIIAYKITNDGKELEITPEELSRCLIRLDYNNN
ncbi:MAG: VCBS repeat-containing protein [Clostridiales bacterium]|nr:VCBS repeat-containing protein [Clostridiales bacterium]